MNPWLPIDTAPKDGTLIDVWLYDDSPYSARICPGVCWGNSVDRARLAGINFWGPVYEGWYYADVLHACNAFLQQHQISHWRIHEPSSAPTAEQLASFPLLRKLKG